MPRKKALVKKAEDLPVVAPSVDEIRADLDTLPSPGKGVFVTSQVGPVSVRLDVPHEGVRAIAKAAKMKGKTVLEVAGIKFALEIEG